MTLWSHSWVITDQPFTLSVRIEFLKIPLHVKSGFDGFVLSCLFKEHLPVVSFPVCEVEFIFMPLFVGWSVIPTWLSFKLFRRLYVQWPIPQKTEQYIGRFQGFSENILGHLPSLLLR